MASTSAWAAQPAVAQFMTFAGKPLLVRSNSCAILRHAVSFFTQLEKSDRLPSHAAVLTLLARDERGPLPEETPRFRGRGYFAMARFTSADAVWFNLRARRAFGVFSQAVISDARRWHKDILPAIAGILAPVLAVLPVHAACLAKQGRGVLLAAPSGTGKSTLAVALARHGYTFLADDWTYLAETAGGVRAWGLPVPVKLLPDATQFFSELLTEQCAPSLNGEIAYEVSRQDCLKLACAEHCRIHSIVLLERSAKIGCRISRIRFATALERLASDIEPLTGSLEAAYRRQLQLLERLSGAACLRVAFNAPPQIVAVALGRALTRLRNCAAPSAFPSQHDSAASAQPFDAHLASFISWPREEFSMERAEE